MIPWSTLGEVPSSLRDALTQAEALFKEEDQRLERATVTALRAERLPYRVPALVDTAMGMGLSLSDAFVVVGMHTGFAWQYIRKIYYRRRCHVPRPR